MPKDDSELVALLRRTLVSDGIVIREHIKITRVEPAGSGIVVVLETEGGGEERIAGSHLLVAAGRQPNIAELGS